MFIDDQSYTQKNGKLYRRVLLRNSYRANGIVQHDTVANLSKCSDEEIEAIRLALKHKGNLQSLVNISEATGLKQGLSMGSLWILHQLSKRLGIVKALGHSREAKLILWLIYAAVIEQGSRLSAVRLAKRMAVCDILGLDSFNEDDLYSALAWLDGRQEKTEQKLFSDRYKEKAPSLFLYDVTSSYFEGLFNELSDWGHNRDGKKGKKQIVIGLLTDDHGFPVSVQVFKGNTSDLATFKAQTEKVKKQFGIDKAVFVGDRGMIKGPQIEELDDDFKYITAITKAEIGKLLKQGVFQMELFDEDVCEVCHDSIRYILRRNPVRAEEMSSTRQSKFSRLQKFLNTKTVYLKEHRRATVKAAIGEVEKKAKALKIDKWVEITCSQREFRVEKKEEELAAESKLDGCYVVKSNVPKEDAKPEILHDRYKGLSEVEWAFRTMKTTFLEMRAIYVRKAVSTRAHVFIIMLAYMLAYELRRLWKDLEVTPEEGISELTELCAVEVIINNTSCHKIPEPREMGKELLKKAQITLPEAIPCRNIKVDTRKKLVPNRRSI